jgi:hypothetical protein
MERTDGVTGGAGTRVRSWSCTFSFPLTLAVNEDFFRINEVRAPAAPVPPSPDEVFSMREKPAANTVDAQRRVVWCRCRADDDADADAAGLRVSGSWC